MGAGVCVAGGNARATPAVLFEGSSSSRVTRIDMDAEGLDDGVVVSR